MKLNPAIVFSIIIIVLGIGMIGYVVSNNRSIDQLVATPQPMAPYEIPEGWSTYVIPSYRWAVAYPSEWGTPVIKNSYPNTVSIFPFKSKEIRDEDVFRTEITLAEKDSKIHLGLIDVSEKKRFRSGLATIYWSKFPTQFGETYLNAEAKINIPGDDYQAHTFRLKNVLLDTNDDYRKVLIADENKYRTDFVKMLETFRVDNER